MKLRYKIALAILVAVAILLTFCVSRVDIPPEVRMNLVAEASQAPVVIPRFTHQQELWMAALEWCESRGNNSAVNWYDKDGTASYYAFQFKPGTLRGFGEKYGVIEKGKSDAEIMELLKVYAIQRSIVEHMVEDPGTKWEQQFPGCTKKLGRPPMK